MDLRQTTEYAGYLRKLGWTVEKKNSTFYFIKKIPLIGSVIKVQRFSEVDFHFLSKLEKKYRAFQTILEPDCGYQSSKIISQGFRQSKSTYLPTKTVLLDLKKPYKALLSEMHHKTRYNIRKSQKLGLKAFNSQDIELFSDFWQKSALRQRGMFISQKKEILALYNAFKSKLDIVFVTASNAKHATSNNVLAGILCIYSRGSAHYMYAAASSLGKKMFAPTLAVWKSIKLAKKKGGGFYDFEGIYDERFPMPSWKGFSRFKMSFGGSVVEYPGSFEKLRIPI
jgi:lipid II:glycine glycyltransferase (peptidoglycan interpeptide bridge formation enzyme)